jgi:hypothetical protein
MGIENCEWTTQNVEKGEFITTLMRVESKREERKSLFLVTGWLLFTKKL